MTKVMVDTNILIDYTNGYQNDLAKLLAQAGKGEIRLLINPVVVAEYLADKKLKIASAKKIADEFLNLFSCTNITKKIGELTGRIIRTHSDLAWRDAMIAACCLIEDCLLATRNRKHFNKIRGLKFI
ncbi:MAG: PIN domain-containing protein [Patescibacteria group bacterium]